MSAGTDRPLTGLSSPSNATGWVRTLDRLAAHAPQVAGVRAESVRAGDWVVVRTRNSTYSLSAIGDGSFAVAGGWFAAQGCETTPVRVSGCTWGGQAIHTGLVAAPGMCLEFGNGVRTTRIQEVRVIRGGSGRQH
jgi:hypothetical protein